MGDGGGDVAGWDYMCNPRTTTPVNLRGGTSGEMRQTSVRSARGGFAQTKEGASKS